VSTCGIAFGVTDVRQILNGTKTMTRRILPCTDGWALGASLYVQEPWRFDGARVRYLASEEPTAAMGVIWHSPREMERRDARLLLRVTEVREEFLQDLSHTDLEAEGYADKGRFIYVWNTHHRTIWQENPRVRVLRFTATRRG
jgi:hypothetical protein